MGDNHEYNDGYIDGIKAGKIFERIEKNAGKEAVINILAAHWEVSPSQLPSIINDILMKKNVGLYDIAVATNPEMFEPDEVKENLSKKYDESLENDEKQLRIDKSDDLDKFGTMYNRLVNSGIYNHNPETLEKLRNDTNNTQFQKGTEVDNTIPEKENDYNSLLRNVTKINHERQEFNEKEDYKVQTPFYSEELLSPKENIYEKEAPKRILEFEERKPTSKVSWNAETRLPGKTF